jgi:hypothetical protein
MKELLIWLYGKSGRNAHIREMAQKTIDLLRKEESMEHQELCQALGIGLDKYQKPKRTFYFVVNPLKRVDLIKEKRVYLDEKKKKYKTVYYLSPDTFYGYMKKTLDDFHSKVSA